MSGIQDQLDKLAVSIFSANVEAASSVAPAAQHLRHIYCTLSDLVTLCKDFERWRDNRALDDASDQLESLQRSADSLEQTYGREQPLELSEIYRRISWKMVQLMSHKLRSCAASLRLRYTEQQTRAVASDAKLIDISGQAIQTLQYDLHNLERQAAQVHVQVVPPVAVFPEPPEIPIVESICTQCSVLQQDVDRLNARVEVYKMKEAMDLVGAGKYDRAAAIYEQLSTVRELELDRKWKAGDKDGEDDAEREALKVKYEVAMMLMKQGKLLEAETKMEHVWQRRQKLFPKNHEDIRSAQQQLCLILRAQRSNRKYKRAERLYADVFTDPELEPRDTWVMYNGHELGMVLIEQGSFLKAEGQLREVLEAAGAQNPAIVETAAQLAALTAERGRAEESADLLRPFFALEPAKLSPKALKCAATVGEKLFELGAYADTERVCGIVWNDAKQKAGARSPGAISAGWHLSLALYFQGQGAKYEEAKAILNSLLQTRPGEITDPSRTRQIKSLLSWVCRKVGDFPQAAEFARSVWEQKGDEDILGPLFSSTGVMRIWLLSRYEQNQDKEKGTSGRKEAREVWNEVLRSTKTRALSHEQKKSLAQRWRTLAGDLDRFAKQRKRKDGSNLARAIEDAAANLTG